MDAIFKKHKSLKIYYKTSDGTKFFEESHAKNHARTLKNNKVTPVNRMKEIEVIASEVAAKTESTAKEAEEKATAAQAEAAAKEAEEKATAAQAEALAKEAEEKAAKQASKKELTTASKAVTENKSKK